MDLRKNGGDQKTKEEIDLSPDPRRKLRFNLKQSRRSRKAAVQG